MAKLVVEHQDGCVRDERSIGGNTACFAGSDLFQRMIRTFGIGRRAQKGVFGRLG